MTDFRKYPPKQDPEPRVCQPIFVKEIDEDNVGYEEDVYREIYE